MLNEAAASARAQDFLRTGFPGFRIQGLQPTTEIFAHELAEFTVALPGLRGFLEREAPWAVKLRREGAGAEAFSSAAYPECPALVFYTELIRFHLPPATVRSPGAPWPHYPVLENLVHESIHHWWGREAAARPELAPLLQREVRVSWRSVPWNLDKALHAGLVYLAATELRWMYAPDAMATARAAATEIFAALAGVDGDWNDGAAATLADPGAGHFLKRLGIR